MQSHEIGVKQGLQINKFCNLLPTAFDDAAFLTRYGKIAEDVELGARPRNVQAWGISTCLPGVVLLGGCRQK